MVNRLQAVLMAVLGGGMALAGCSQQPTPTAQNQKLPVMVSIAPQKYFVERIGDGYVKVGVMVPPGAEPHTFEPKPEQLKALSRAKAYFRIRIDFEEAWMDKLAAVNPRMAIVDTTQGIQRLPIPGHFHQEGAKTQAGEGENLDPHIWLSPRLVKVQARTIYEALSKLAPQHQAAYQANLEQFLADIDQLDADIRQTLQGVKNRQFIVFHPAWGYFARDYDLEMITIAVGGQEPSAAELGNLIREAKQAGIKVVFVEPQFSKQAAATIAREIGGEVLAIDPLAADWLANLRQVARTLGKVLGDFRF
jgi:zinc transport system substrate-binding protein